MLLLAVGDPAKRGADVHPDLIAVLALQIEPRVREGEARRGERELRVAVGAAQGPPLEPIARVEVADLGGDPRAEVARIEASDRAHRRLAPRSGS